MRVSNFKVKRQIISVYFILILFAVFFTIVFSAFSDLTNNPTLAFGVVVLSFVLLFFFVYFISKYFEYDSDGIKVVVINRGLLLSDYFNYRENKLEFEKEQLQAYKFQDYIVYKTLTLYAKNSRGITQKKSFNVTLVARKKRRYIKQSLIKMIKNNRNN